MKGLRVPPSPCPGCGAKLDGAAGVGQSETPDPGSLTVCAYCRGISMFGDDLRLRRLTQAEADEISRDPALALMLRRANLLIDSMTAGQN